MDCVHIPSYVDFVNNMIFFFLWDDNMNFFLACNYFNFKSMYAAIQISSFFLISMHHLSNKNK